ncbi:MAG TPA: MMPL family transporter [Candidatus Paceibacterota bacterium]|jgi:hopanoid biosynthesis associated RND transporter like protein HpnN|nr:MMPL family transporter [Verrucomicrobiota bacterium]HRY59382.1 MMPL family transporter [Candidatus Paceibacterota bacterium]HQH03693.1 MMPL family transporter [Verrucomicrobiota bacterium]HQJ49098.1 MMPL family transporter [Verrucomicrobiota bacterium]HRD04038.1 MMPL family transporter [Verrucomicrobiota bacterium]
MRIKPLSTDNLMARFLAGLARVVLRHPRLFLYPQLVLFAGGLVVTLKYPGIEFNTSRNDLVGANKKYHQNFLRLKKEFPTQDDLVVVVESEDGEKNRQFVDRLGAKLEAETNLFNHVFYKGDLKMLGSKALLLVPENDLADLRLILKDFQPFIAQFTRTTNLVSLFRLICTQFRTAKQEASEANESLLKALPALERIITQATDSLRRSGAPPSPGITALFDPGEEAQQQMYITFAQGRIYLVTAQAPTEELNTAAVLRLRELVEETKLEVLGINVGLTGEPVLELDEMAQSQKDTALASVVALALCALIFIYGYQETGRPVKATFCLIIGLGYTLGFATLVIGHLNILTITFMPILIGLAIDYGVHLISRYEEELRRGEAMETALTRAMVLTGQGILTGGLTTAGGFLAMGLTNFKGIQEMGIICGGGLVICLVPMMTLLPVLLLRGRQNVVDRQLSPAAERRAWIENLWLRRPVLTAGVTLALCGLAATQLRKVYFDYNLVNMQSKGLPAVEYEKALIASTPKSVLFGAVVATNLAQAGALERQLTNLSAVASVDSINGFLSEDQTRKLAVVGQIKQELAAVRFSEPDPRPVELQELSAVLYSLRGYLGAALDAVRAEQPELVPQFESLRDAIQALRKEMLRGNDRQVAANALKLAEFQRRLFLDIRDTFQALRTQDDRAPLSVADLPPALRDRFIGVTGKYLLMVYPQGDIWQREVQETFIRQVEKIYPDVTGTPVQLYYYTALLKESYEQAAWYSLGAIGLLVFFHFRSLTSVLLALVPVAIGSLWLVGLMGWLDVPFNPANIMTLPLVIGIGVTNGIHVLNRFAEEQSPSILARSTGKAVLVSCLTSMAGFGSLMLARHQGIYSLGCVMTTGLATCMIAGLTFLPALLNLLVRPRVSTE